MNSTLTPNATAAMRSGKPAGTLSPAILQLQLFITQGFKNLQIVYTLGFGSMFLLSVCLVIYLRRCRVTAQQGDVDAARKIILPTFEPLLWVLCGITGCYMLYFLMASSISYTGAVLNLISAEAMYQGRQFIFFLITAYIYQKSVSLPALYRSIVISLIISGTPIVVIAIMSLADVPTTVNYYFSLIYRTPIVLFYVYMFCFPISRASKQSIRAFCIYLLIYYPTVYLYNEMYRQVEIKWALYLTFVTIGWGSLTPYFIWCILKADTEHWRGLGQRACDLQILFREKHAIQEIISAQGLHVLLEMHRRYVIDFAHLKLDHEIGAGASAAVYQGVLNSKIQVAVKVYSPYEISEETVAEFSQEAALCGALDHPNIVAFHGMCVCPPTICLVSELCQGSLDDLFRLPRGVNKSLLARVGYMLDATRAMAYLHSFSPPFIHRDIKPANLLLDHRDVVKLTDFGESRSLAKPNTISGSSSTINSHDENDSCTLSSSATNTISKPNQKMAQMTIRGTVDYMAPEIINGKRGQAIYSESADIYSLAITLWDILHPGMEKYPNGKNNHMNVFLLVLDGKRPAIDETLPPSLREMLESGWSAHPEMRPSAANIVSILESIQEELCAPIACDIFQSAQSTTKVKKKTGIVMNQISGEEIIQTILQHNVAMDVVEGIRLGNALMDSGFLHHHKHSKPFENSPVQMYFFDENNIELCQPIRNKQHSRAETETMSQYTSNTHPHSSKSMNDDLYENGFCACRKLAQGFYTKKVNKKKFFKKRKADENFLTVKLLNDGIQDEFEGFEEHRPLTAA